MSRYRESGFGGYILLVLLSGLFMIVVSFFLAVVAGMLFGLLNIGFGEIFDFNKIISQNTWVVIVLWFLFWLFCMYIVYMTLWKGRSFR